MTTRKAAREAEMEKQQQAEIPSGPIKFVDILLTNHQHLIINSMLPKGFSFQPIKKSIKKIPSPLPDQSSQKINHSLEQQEILSPKKLLKTSNNQISQSFTSKQIDVSRKSERLFLQEKVTSYNEDSESNISRKNPGKEEIVQISENQREKNQINDRSDSNIKWNDEGKKQEGRGHKSQPSFNVDAVPVDQEDLIEATAHKRKGSRKKKKEKSRSQQKKERSAEHRSKQIVIFESAARSKFENQWILLKKLQNHTLSQPFLQPVDENIDGARGYYKIIKSPIDLRTIERKFLDNAYKQREEFHSDVRRMLANSYEFNLPKSGMAKITKIIERFYEGQVGKIKK